MTNKTILWIEDDADIIEPVIRPLQAAGINFVYCRTYAEALTYIKVIHKFDLILLDLIIPPGKSDVKGEYLGLQFLRRLRNEFAIKTPVIAFSVIANEKPVEAELEALDATSLGKPMRPSQLKARVLEVLGLLPD